MQNNNFGCLGELHCHQGNSRLSYAPFLNDSILSVKTIVDGSIERGVEILCISDHDSLEGYIKAKEYLAKIKNKSILLIPGEEVSSRDGHILAYGIKSKIASGFSAKVTVEKIHEQGGLAVAAHPYSVFGVGKLMNELDFDAIEGYNASLPKWINSLARKNLTKLLPCMAGSDGHQEYTMGRGLLVFKEKLTTVDQVLQAIKKGNFEVKAKYSNLLLIVWSHLWGHIQMLRG